MRSRVIVKCRKRFEYFYEKIMEWFYSISYRTIPIKTPRNSLIEEYIIHESYAGESFVKDFLKERTSKAVTNRYCIKITTTQEPVEEKEYRRNNFRAIGKVRLLRKRCLIDEAVLMIKNDDNNLIYWNFNK